MKYLWFLFASGLFIFFSCSVDEKEVLNVESSFTRAGASTSIFYVSREEALKMSEIKWEETFGVEQKIESVIPFPNAEDANLYIVNSTEGGFDIISADKRIEPLLYYAEEGNVSIPLENKNFLFMLEFLSERIEQVKKTEEVSETQRFNYHKWDVISGTTGLGGEKTKGIPDYIYIIQRCAVRDTLSWVGPFCDAKWGQAGPDFFYNYYCPYSDINMYNHCVAGCVAVAGAQALYTLHKNNNVPISIPMYAHVIPGQYTYRAQWFDRSRSSTYIDEMPLFISDTNAVKKEHVRIFIAHIGNLVGMNYGISESSAPEEYLYYRAFPDYYVTSYICQGDESEVLDKLIINAPREKPIVLTGSSSNPFDCHAWISDGFREVHYIITDYCYNSGKTPLTAEQQFYLTMDDWNYVTTSRGYTRYYHMNWGWDGLHDGWVSLDSTTGFSNTSSYYCQLSLIWF